MTLGTGPEVAMNIQLTAGLISGGVALVVALLGIAGAIAAQVVATRRSFENSLALFERQHARQEASRKQERAEEARREDAYRYAEQRRSTYAKLLRVAADLVDARLAADAAAETWRNIRDLAAGEDPEETQAKEERNALNFLQDTSGRWAQISADLDEVAGEVELLASPDVRQTASELEHIASKPADLAEAPVPIGIYRHALSRYSRTGPLRVSRTYAAAQAAFLDAARRELGIGIGPDPNAGTGTPPSPNC